MAARSRGIRIPNSLYKNPNTPGLCSSQHMRILATVSATAGSRKIATVAAMVVLISDFDTNKSIDKAAPRSISMFDL